MVENTISDITKAKASSTTTDSIQKVNDDNDNNIQGVNHELQAVMDRKKQNILSLLAQAGMAYKEGSDELEDKLSMKVRIC